MGMGEDLFESFRSARETFEEADDNLGFPLSRIIFEGPAPELQSTINSQPAIMTVSIAAFRAWQEYQGASASVAAAAAGHSLGEYTSLVAAGVLEFADAVKLVRRRGELMQQASVDRPGSMAAILGLDELALAQVCAETGVELANINSDNQIVISGDRIAVARAMDLASARGARKTVPLPVSGAFPLLPDGRGKERPDRGHESPDVQRPQNAHSGQLRLETTDYRGRSPPGIGRWPLSVRPMEQLRALPGRFRRNAICRVWFRRGP